MRITIITPAKAGSRNGNRVTALRWARILKEQGHRVDVDVAYRAKRPDLMVALHARRSHEAMVRFRKTFPERPLFLALTGTDLYGDIHTDANAQEALHLADRLILLQSSGLDEMTPDLHPKVRVIFQSVPTPTRLSAKDPDCFEIALIGHMRPVKDPFLPAKAIRELPGESKISLVHIGGAMEAEMARLAKAEAKANARYRWLGEMPRWKCLRKLAKCRLLVLPSLSEGGANVISEALVAGVPVVASDIPGNRGMLGAGYPGYFPVGNADALRTLLLKAEQDGDFLQTLTQWCRDRAALFAPQAEAHAWEKLLSEFPAIAEPEYAGQGNSKSARKVIIGGQ